MVFRLGAPLVAAHLADDHAMRWKEHAAKNGTVNTLFLWAFIIALPAALITHG